MQTSGFETSLKGEQKWPPFFHKIKKMEREDIHEHIQKLEKEIEENERRETPPKVG